MELITLRSQTMTIVERWKEQYCNPGTKRLNDDKRQDILHKLEALDLTKASPQDIADIIGNDSWVCAQNCDECGQRPDTLVVVGAEPDYESATAALCYSCINKARELFPYANTPT